MTDRNYLLEHAKRASTDNENILEENSIMLLGFGFNYSDYTSKKKLKKLNEIMYHVNNIVSFGAEKDFSESESYNFLRDYQLYIYTDRGVFRALLFKALEELRRTQKKISLSEVVATIMVPQLKYCGYDIAEKNTPTKLKSSELNKTFTGSNYFRNNKKGTMYEVLSYNILNCTNAQDGQKMILYRSLDDITYTYTREYNEFFSKFTQMTSDDVYNLNLNKKE